jgi:hypothetical protein
MAEGRRCKCREHPKKDKDLRIPLADRWLTNISSIREFLSCVVDKVKRCGFFGTVS